MVSSNTRSISEAELRSSFTIEGGLARENPVPTTLYPARWNARRTCRPRRPVAPVTRAVFDMAELKLLGPEVGSDFKIITFTSKTCQQNAYD